MWKDLFSAGSENYARFRPRYPDKLFAYLSSLVLEHKVAFDCATGNGQAALSLVSYFDQVIASDASREQIEHAPHHERIRYMVSSAENNTLADKSIDLMTVAQAFHWFNHEAFFAEAKRTLKNDGVLAIWCYDLCTINPKIDQIISSLYHDLLGPFWDQERLYVEEGYQKNIFPLKEIRAPIFHIDASWDLSSLLGYLSSWSPQIKFERARGHSALSEISAALRAAWGDPAQQRSVRWPLHMRVGHF